MRKIILCDLDGTLADCGHRIRHIQKSPKDWRSFFAECGDDAPILHLIELLRAVDRKRFEIWITSGRSDECYRETISWLDDHSVPYDRLIMRKSGDFTDDGILKPSWLADGTIPKDRVLLALDDRNRVVKAWREAGIPVPASCGWRFLMKRTYHLSEEAVDRLKKIKRDTGLHFSAIVDRLILGLPVGSKD